MTPERLNEIREYKDQCSKAHNMKVELLAEIDRLLGEIKSDDEWIIDAEKEIDKLRAENKNLSEAHEAAQHYKQQRDELKDKLAVAIEALEAIAYWKSDANVCCFPVDCHEALSKIRGEQ